MNVLIVEDEPLIAQRLERLTREILGAELHGLHVVSTLDAAIPRLERADHVVLLLDLNLGREDGFELLRRAVAEPWSTVVVSGSAERAVEAFELGVSDFVPKPFTVERLGLAFRRVRERTRDTSTRWLAVAFAGRVDLVALDTIVAIHGDDDYSSVELDDGQRRLHKRTLTELERLLPHTFLRVHRSHVVNLGKVRGFENGDGGRLLRLINGNTVPVGRAYRDTLLGKMI